MRPHFIPTRLPRWGAALPFYHTCCLLSRARTYHTRMDQWRPLRKVDATPAPTLQTRGVYPLYFRLPTSPERLTFHPSNVAKTTGRTTVRATRVQLQPRRTRITVCCRCVTKPLPLPHLLLGSRRFCDKRFAPASLSLLNNAGTRAFLRCAWLGHDTGLLLAMGTGLPSLPCSMLYLYPTPIPVPAYFLFLCLSCLWYMFGTYVSAWVRFPCQ